MFIRSCKPCEGRFSFSLKKEGLLFLGIEEEVFFYDWLTSISKEYVRVKCYCPSAFGYNIQKYYF